MSFLIAWGWSPAGWNFDTSLKLAILVCLCEESRQWRDDEAIPKIAALPLDKLEVARLPTAGRQ